MSDPKDDLHAKFIASDADADDVERLCPVLHAQRDTHVRVRGDVLVIDTQGSARAVTA